jgi:poly(3-hydroxybutyrate) depolymerase
MRKKNLIVAVAVLLLATASALAQARPNLALQRVIYNTMKTMAKPQGELKDKLDALDKEMAEAARAGRTGEVRHLLAKGTTLLAGREWTDALEFSNSLVLRAEEVCVDSSLPYTVRLEQIYAPQVQVSGPLTVRLTLHKLGRSQWGVQAGEKLKDLGQQDGVGRDLQDDPCRIELDLSGNEDGTYLLQAEILEKERSLGTSTLAIGLWKGLSEQLHSIETDLSKIEAFDSFRADVLYPLDHIRNVNRGRFEMGTFQVSAELEAAEDVLTSIKNGKDPFASRTGDMERHYFLEGANEIMPYRVYVPKMYNGKTAYPLIIALHGLGGTEDSFFDSYEKQVPKLAEEHGYIVAAPLGYRVDGFYGKILFGNPEDAGVKRKAEYSERDVMSVLELMRKNYRIDTSRIYLMGHSMGAIGTWHLGAKYPEIWAALAPFAGFGDPSGVARMKRIPEIVVHGDADPTVPVAGSRAMVAEMKKQGVQVQYIEVPKGNHMDIVVPNLGVVFDFFDKHRKATSEISGR